MLTYIILGICILMAGFLVWRRFRIKGKKARKDCCGDTSPSCKDCPHVIRAESLKHKRTG